MPAQRPTPTSSDKTPPGKTPAPAAAPAAQRTRKKAASSGTAKKSAAPKTPAPRRAPAARKAPVPPPVPLTIGRIPVRDVRPVVDHGRRPAKAVVGETFQVTATVFREGHDAVAANVVLRGPDGKPGPWAPMRELAPGTDRWGAEVTPDAPGAWTFTVEAWGDPVATWRHAARIKIPAGIDTELVMEEGALLYERAAADLPKPLRETVLQAVAALRDTDRQAATRLAAALTPDIDTVLSRHPLRELVTPSEPMPLLVERERALYGAWYEFF
ncbi:maltotransferase domain-containing protein, partial [Streptomyces sp. NPDC050264]|uniref:maltotransferase domain-containing protein n=1 Tax=Streptomyces sp. NPDC050264 TaxID=3155038 RepID=UPI003444F091